MRRPTLHVLVLVLCLLAGRLALAAHDALHAAPGAGDTCVACLHGGAPDGAAPAASSSPALTAHAFVEPSRRAASPTLRLQRRYLGRAPPVSLV